MQLNQTNNNNYSQFFDASLLPCEQVRVFGVLYALLTISSIVTNIIVVWTIYKNKPLHTAINYIIAIFSVNNLVNSFIQLPFISINAFSCRFLFSDAGCVYLSIIYTINMVTNVYFFIMISVERYLVICKPFKNIKFNIKRSLCVIIPIIVTISAAWSLSPLIGIAEYGYEYSKTSCVISGVGSNRTLFVVISSIFIYIIPIIILILTNVASIHIVRQSTKKFKNDRINRQILKKEAHLVKITITLIATFFCSAFPQSIIPILRIYIEGTQSLYLFSTFTIFLTRTSVLTPALVNMFLNRDIKRYLFKNAKTHNLSTTT